MTEPTKPNDGFSQPTAAPTPAPKRRARVAASTKPISPALAAKDKTQDKTDPMDVLVCITLHDSDRIPPGGQFVGVNGKQYKIPPGRKVIVPRSVCAVLDNAVMGVPDINEKMQVVGHKDQPRLTYTVHLDEVI